MQILDTYQVQRKTQFGSSNAGFKVTGEAISFAAGAFYCQNSGQSGSHYRRVFISVEPDLLSSCVCGGLCTLDAV